MTDAVRKYDPNLSFVIRISPREYNKRRIEQGFTETWPTWETGHFNELMRRYKLDLGADLSEAKSALLHRIVALQVACDFADADLKEGTPLPDDYSKNTNTLFRLLKELGLERSQRDVTPGSTLSPMQQVAAELAQLRASAAEAEVMPPAEGVQ